MLKPNEVRILLLLADDLGSPVTIDYIIRNVNIHRSHIYKYLKALNSDGLVNKVDGEFDWEISRNGISLLRIMDSRIKSF